LLCTVVLLISASGRSIASTPAQSDHIVVPVLRTEGMPASSNTPQRL
jgi:hypothetical protein